MDSGSGVVRPEFAAAQAFQRASYLPGEIGQVDWWHTGIKLDVDCGSLREALGLVVTLPHSAAHAVVFTLAKDVPAFLAGLLGCLTRLGGTPEKSPIWRPRRDRRRRGLMAANKATSAMAPSASEVAYSRKTSQAGRDAFLARFERDIDPDGVLSDAGRQRRAEHARKSNFASLALKSEQARRKTSDGPTGRTDGG